MTVDRDENELDVETNEWPPGLDDASWDAKVQAREAAAADKRFRDITEDAIALAFVDVVAGNALYCHNGRSGWLVWKDTHWQRDERREVFHHLREFTRGVCVTRTNKRERMPGGGARFCRGAEQFCQADPRVAVTADIFDQDDWLLGTPCGVVDLRCGDIRPARPDDYITKLTAVGPAPGGTPCPIWTKFLTEATNGDNELAAFIKRYCGYSLTGVTAEQCLLFVYGLGGNGKGVLVNTVRRVMASYATTAAMTTFASRKFDPHPEELASLIGARLVTASETEEGRTWDEVKVKQLTGGDDIRTRFMRENSFAVRPNFKLLFVGNSTPNMAHLDDAWRRRFHLAEFNHNPVNPDMELELKLEDEYPAILSWMIDGCTEWQQIGLRPPASVIATTKEYFSEQDVFGAWLREQCDVEPGNPHKKETSARLYESWCSYAKTHQHEPGTMKAFSASMKRNGLQPKPIKAFKSRGYEGIQLNQPSGWEDR